MGALKENLKLDLQTLSKEDQTIVEQTLALSLRWVFLLNPKNLDDLNILKPLTEIQACFVMLGFREQVL